MNPPFYLTLMILFPLGGALINAVVRLSGSRSGVLATLCSSASFLASVALFFLLSSTPITTSFEWFSVGEFRVDWGFSLDALSSLMTLIVSGIGTLIHLYSIGYMAHDKSQSRYFAYLGLFLFAMLVLVCADNLIVLFVGWEGVGLCSYLLIGFWHEDIHKAQAGMKAFVVNRIGDAGFLLGIFMCLSLFETTHFTKMKEIISLSSSLSVDLLSWAAFFLFVGAMGKSAQIPLFVWLPDAMAGPTPVSALIHAATMVTAGVYLVARLSFLYQVAGTVNHFIAMTGAITAVFAATIATSQRDIKKVLAYSTISQLGLMFLGAGVGNYFAAIFHVMTHAFFKALLFLGAGSIIHALEGEQDICKMGGLAKKLPATFATFTIGTFALAGIPPLAGFFSKDTILFSTLGPNGSFTLWTLGSIASLLTAFYMGRLFTLVFLGTYRGVGHPHESPQVMTLPLVVLAVGSIAAGWLGFPEGFHLLPNALLHFLSPIVPEFLHEVSLLSEKTATFIAIGISGIGVGLGVFFYHPAPEKSEAASAVLRPFQTIFYNKFWVDELYDVLLIKPWKALGFFLANRIDYRVIDKSLVFLSQLCRAGSTFLSLIHNGSVQLYLWLMLFGALAVLWIQMGGLVF